MDSGVLKCCFIYCFYKGQVEYVVASGVLKCLFSIGFIKEIVLWGGFCNVKRLMLYWF